MVKTHHELRVSPRKFLGWKPFIYPVMNIGLCLTAFAVAAIGPFVSAHYVGEHLQAFELIIARSPIDSNYGWAAIGFAVGVLSSAATCVAVHVAQHTSVWRRVHFKLAVNAAAAVGCGFYVPLGIAALGFRSKVPIATLIVAGTIALSVGLTGIIGTYLTRRFRRLNLRILFQDRRG
jgi:hypothetical protein